MTERTLVIVVGVGRSGTSMAMLSLAALGAGVSAEVVPASPQNPKGTLEPLAMRDMMQALHRRLGRFAGLRPRGWDDMPAARLAEMQGLSMVRALFDQTGRDIVAIKFPLASIYLPLWEKVAAGADARLKLVWATRGVSQTYASFAAAYDHGAKVAQQRILQRSYYILRDAPADTLCLPFEGWNDDPEAQVRRLAGFTGLPHDPAAVTAFDPSLFDRAEPASDFDPGPVLARLEALLTGNTMTLGQLRADSAQDLAIVMDDMKEALTGEAESPAPQRTTDPAPTGELVAELSREVALREELCVRLRQERDALAAEKEARVADMRALALAHDREIEALRRGEGIASAKVAEQIAITQRHVRRIKKMEAEMKELRATSGPPTLADLRQHPAFRKLREANRSKSRELRRIHRSLRWRAGSLASQARGRPMRMLLLPFRLIGLALRR